MIVNESSQYTFLLSNNTINDSIWHHGVMVIDKNGSNKGYLYVDGLKIYESTLPSGDFYDAAESIKIGADPNNGNNWLGYLDDVRIYNRALSADEIQTLYSNSAGRYH